ncbi:aldo/keto reductase [Cellulomonas sp. NPDC089187]|uniref:aldo/keto reductase n=1 Tax=Cellulomonas sp. NPDC089187 TaxID=3154970 RepID=UPI003426A33F
MTDIPTLTLNNGVTLPALGLGVFQSAPEETTSAVETALRLGYRHLDTAAAYGNEREVGAGIVASGVPREEIVVETKVWVSDYGRDQTLRAVDKATGKLGLDVIDILILHQPLADHFDRTIAAYQALEEVYAAGRVRAIGVSNFTVAHLDRLAEHTDIVPALNQVELHPHFQQKALQAAHAERGILTQAWSPIGGITFYPGWGEDRQSVMDDPELHTIAADHGASPAQVMLRWHLQQGRSAIPKSTNPDRIRQNITLDLTLSAEELARIDALDAGRRSGPDPDHRDSSALLNRTIPDA